MNPHRPYWTMASREPGRDAVLTHLALSPAPGRGSYM